MINNNEIDWNSIRNTLIISLKQGNKFNDIIFECETYSFILNLQELKEILLEKYKNPEKGITNV